MNFAGRLGLTNEEFCEVVISVKMFGMVAVLGHVSELKYEKLLESQNITFKKASNDEHFDYEIKGKRYQVKRFEAAGTTKEKLVANLTKTHGNRTKSGTGSNYFRTDFDYLVILDVNGVFHTVDVNDIKSNSNNPDQLSGKHAIKRDLFVKPENASLQSNIITQFQNDFLEALKHPNEKYFPAMEVLRKKHKIATYIELWQKISNITLDETYNKIFTVENFRLIVAAKGYCAEEHLKKLLRKNSIKFQQTVDMYGKSDFTINRRGYQVKTLYPRGTTKDHWAFKTHKSHGAKLGELYRYDAWDVTAVFVGYEPNIQKEIDVLDDPYTPINTTTSFIFVPIDDIPPYVDVRGSIDCTMCDGDDNSCNNCNGTGKGKKGKIYNEYLKRVTRVLKSDYKINDLTNF